MQVIPTTGFAPVSFALVHRLIVSICGLLLGVLPSSGQEWTRFRGPNGTGLSDARSIPVTWSESDYQWKVKLPGGGHSSPVLWGNRIFLSSADEADFSILCLDGSDGRVVWKRDYPHGEYDLHRFNSFASASCALDDERVYFTRQNSGRMFLCALTHGGEPVWELPLGAFDSQHGGSHSPVIHGELVVLAYDQVLDGRILAVDRKTGEERWSIPRKAGTADYSVPCLFEQPGRAPVLLFNTREDGIAGVDPVAGRIMWKTADNALTLRSVSSPVVAGGVTFASCGSGGGGNYVIAVEPPAGGEGVARIKYDIRRSAPYVPTPIAYRDRVYLWSDGGIVTCIDPVTGEQKWQERAGGNYFSSPVCIDGRLYGSNDSGEVVVLQTGDTFKELARNDLGEMTRATPAVANGRIYFRTFEHLICLGGEVPGRVN
jgi:outer membrane protein assembly factor BamB